MASKELVILDYDEIIKETEKASLFRIGEEEDPDSRFWIPKSLIRDLDEEKREITIPEWIAIKLGLV